MRIAILALGSRGDVEPLVSLGAGLRRRGHGVVLATHDTFAGMVAAAGLAFVSLGGDARANLERPEFDRLRRARSPFAMMQQMRALLAPTLDDALPGARAACRDADVVVHSSLALVALPAAAEHGIPVVAAHLQPAVATHAMPSAFIPSLHPPPAALNRASATLTERLMWRVVRPVLAAQSRSIGVAPPRRSPPRPTVLHAYSPSIVERPADWPPDVHVTGYWPPTLPPGWAPPPAVERFLGGGPQPIYAGFGSMPDTDPRALARTLIAGARRAGHRVVLATGWSGLDPEDIPDAGDDVLVVDDVPHAWLFPRVAAAVHHGGSGTTGAALRAGIPSVVVPGHLDQFFWARRVAALGVGPAPFPRRDLTARALAEALARSADHRDDARRLALVLTEEDGVTEACRILERL